MKTLQFEDGSWPMTEKGYVTMGSEYGSVGVGMTFLELYENTGNETYLIQANEVAEFIISQGVWMDDNFVLAWTPQELDSEFDGLIVYGLGAGLAGALEFFLDIYKETNIPKYLKIAEGLGNSIVDGDKGGYWLDGTVSYISRIFHGNDALTGYQVGSSGIASSLVSIFENTGNLNYLQASARAEKFVVTLLNDEKQLPIGLTYQSNYFTGFAMGSSGLAHLQLQLYNKFGISRHLELAESIFSHLHQILTDQGLIPVDETLKELGYAFNLNDGLAGIGNSVLLLLSVTAGTDSHGYQNYYKNSNPNFQISAVINSTNDSSDFGFVYPFILMIIILTYHRRVRAVSQSKKY